jgi:hypothetical protein
MLNTWQTIKYVASKHAPPIIFYGFFIQCVVSYSYVWSTVVWLLIRAHKWCDFLV